MEQAGREPRKKRSTLTHPGILCVYSACGRCVAEDRPAWGGASSWVRRIDQHLTGAATRPIGAALNVAVMAMVDRQSSA